MRARARTQDVDAEAKSFHELLVPKPLVSALERSGFSSPSPVQERAIPLGRAGADLIVQAKSGTGKTLAFTVIALERIDATNALPQALVLAPTREIALQITQVMEPLALELPEPVCCGAFIGGLSMVDDLKRLRRRCQIVVGSPGRVVQLVDQDALKLDAVRLLVLDEADRLLSDSFYTDVAWLRDCLPTRKQVLAFSATFTPELLADLEPLMRRPQQLLLCSENVSLTGVRQFYLTVAPAFEDAGPDGRGAVPDGGAHGDAHRPEVLEKRLEALLKLLSRLSFHQAVVFCNRRSAAEWVAATLGQRGFPAAFMSGRKEQQLRSDIMQALRSFQLRVVVSTDLVSRGVDLEHVNLVVNLDLPEEPATYAHRVGRTGRFGSLGLAVTLVTPAELPQLQALVAQVPGGLVSELPENIPSEWYQYQPESERAQQALLALQAAAPEVPVHAPIHAPRRSAGTQRSAAAAAVPDAEAPLPHAAAADKEGLEEEVAAQAWWSWCCANASTYGMSPAQLYRWCSVSAWGQGAAAEKLQDVRYSAPAAHSQAGSAGCGLGVRVSQLDSLPSPSDSPSPAAAAASPMAALGSSLHRCLASSPRWDAQYQHILAAAAAAASPPSLAPPPPSEAPGDTAAHHALHLPTDEQLFGEPSISTASRRARELPPTPQDASRSSASPPAASPRHPPAPARAPQPAHLPSGDALSLAQLHEAMAIWHAAMSEWSRSMAFWYRRR